MSNDLQLSNLDSNLAVLGASPARLDILARLGLHTVSDLLFHFPRAYDDLTDLRWIKNLSEGILQTVQGEVVELDSRTLPSGGFVASVVISDEAPHVLEGVWFNQAGAARRFRFGQRVSFSGRAKWYRDHWQMTNPRVQILDGNSPARAEIVPVYPLTEDLRLEHLRPLIIQALDRCSRQVVDILPDSLRIKYGWLPVAGALREIHQPTALEAAEQARRRFTYEEFFVLQVALALRRREIRDRERAPSIPVTPKIDTHIRRLFPFALTADQNRAVAEITRDLARARPMQRLLQADVGAGKTAVAVYALLATVANRHQAALMAPTEVLARQHYQTLERYLMHSKVRRLLLTSGLSASERRQALAAIAAGEIDLVVGTQSLVQEAVRFARLALVVIDEQHKFGVNQRARMRQLGDAHYLVMTATPIPRTVALTLFGDLDVSVIHEMPPGRQHVTTRWYRSEERPQVISKLREGLAQGRQAYLVYPLVEESEALDVKAATQTHAELQAGPLAEFRLGLLHGRLPDEGKAQVMDAFRNHQLDVLVCTSVVEVGIDVPNATLLLIEHADRFGLSQLHQLRGRVSRGPVAGQCYLIADPLTEDSTERLRLLVRIRDGFALAEADMKLRGAGELFGTRQHGLGEFRFADPIKDADLLQQARHDAIQLVTHDAQLKQAEHAALRRAVLQRYGQSLDLANVG